MNENVWYHNAGDIIDTFHSKFHQNYKGDEGLSENFFCIMKLPILMYTFLLYNRFTKKKWTSDDFLEYMNKENILSDFFFV